MEDTHYCWSQCCDLGPHACICGNDCEMTMTNDLRARIKAEQLAAEKYRIIAIDGAPSGHAVRNAFVDGYLTARTISTEELETAAEALASRDARLRRVADESDKKQYRDYARAAFEAVGFTVGGGE